MVKDHFIRYLINKFMDGVKSIDIEINVESLYLFKSEIIEQ